MNLWVLTINGFLESPFMAAGLAMEIGIIIPNAAATQLNFPAFRRLAQFRAGIAVDDPHAGHLLALWAFISHGIHIFSDSHRTSRRETCSHYHST